MLNLFSPVITKLVPAGIPNVNYHIHFSQKAKEGDESIVLIDYKFTTYDIICLAFCSIIGVWYILKKVNIFISWTDFFVICETEMMKLSSMKIRDFILTSKKFWHGKSISDYR